MKSPVSLRFGHRAVPLDEGAFRAVEVVAARIPPILAPPEAILRRRLARPVASPRLRELLKKGDTVGIPISDVTRYSATELFLPHLLEETDAAGIPRRHVTLFVARGTHRALTNTELAEAVGPEIESGIRVEQSDPEGDTKPLGTTSRGTPVKVCRSLMERDKIVLTGTISFHYFAGFGGGRKALVPGCAARETAMATHFRIFRTDGPGKHPMARPGVLARNPVHEDIVEAVSLAPPVFLLNTLLAPD
ncbi:MAG: lactate racemase domain-containing protein [Deltaproteobacteria bacterium]|nr:lactate racemase domain-containing protein [Deltaproteobacteria bacterium]